MIVSDLPRLVNPSQESVRCNRRCVYSNPAFVVPAGHDINGRRYPRSLCARMATYVFCGFCGFCGLRLILFIRNTSYEIRNGDIILLEGAVRGSGASRYYAPVEFPAVADFERLSKMRKKLDANKHKYHLGLSFGTDALYRESESLISLLRQLNVFTIELV